MDSLANYGSDDDYEEPTPYKKPAWRSGSPDRSPVTRHGSNVQADVNYEEVQMDLSEESDDSSDSDRDSNEDRHKLLNTSRQNSKESEYGNVKKFQVERKKSASDNYQDRGSRESPKYKDDDNKYRDGRYKDKCTDKKDDRYKEDRDKYKEDRDKYKDDRDRYDRDKYRDDRDKYRDEKDKSRRDDREKSKDDREKSRDDREKYRDERRARRSGSRERQKSRSPRRSEYRGRRSTSRERSSKAGAYSKRYDRASNKMAQLEKLGIEIKTPDCQYVTPSELQRSMDDQKKERGQSDRFFMPGITGRFTEQIQKRKLLWQKKQPENEVKPVINVPVAGPSTRTGKVWESTTFAQDTDGKVANKFKRLMGIKGSAEEAAKQPTDNLKKQEEMFSSMEQQYEVARTATHTMRGVGLGFGSFQR